MDGIIVGNKTDLIKSENNHNDTILDLSKSLNMPFISTSALSGDNVNEAFYTLAKILYEISLKKEKDGW